MNQMLPITMTVDDFLQWSVRQESGRYELEAGRVIAMPSESYGHVRIKHRIKGAFVAAIARAGAPCTAVPGGMAVRVAIDTCYEPDFIVAPLPEPADEALEMANPLVVVEVLSKWSAHRDLTVKVAGYARSPTIAHYVVVDPAERVVLHFRRKGEALLPPEAILGD